MDHQTNTSDNNANRKPSPKMPAEVVQNPNPKANENLRIRTDEPKQQDQEPAHGVGSETTDGEDA
jgi:hypothetical protein